MRNDRLEKTKVILLLGHFSLILCVVIDVLHDFVHVDVVDGVRPWCKEQINNERLIEDDRSRQTSLAMASSACSSANDVLC